MIIDQLFTHPIFESQTDPITQFASNAHEEWRRNFDPTGTKPRIKKNSDGTEGDINVPFADLHPDWQKENLAAGRAAQHAVKHFGRDMEKAAEFIHRQWMKRNPKADYNAAQHVPYDDLSDDEKEKDRVHVRTMMRLMGHQTNESGLRKFSHKKNRFKSLHKLQNPLGEEDAIDPSRRGFLKKAAGAAVAGAAMSAAGPEIVTLVKGFAEQAGGMNGIQALKAMLKVATAEELYNMYDYQADSGILADAITDSDMRALQRVKGFRDYEDWSDFEEYCEDNNDVNPVEEFERLTGRSLKVSLVNDILEKVDDTWSLEDFFDEYPDALKIINPFENGSISMPTLQQLGYIDTAAKGAHLPAPIVAMANAVSGLVRQIFKSNGQSLAAPQQTTAHPARHTPALPAPTRPEFDMTPDLKQKEKVPVQRKGDDEEQYYRPAPEHIQQALDSGELGDKNFFQSIVDGTDKNPWVTPEKAQEILNKYYGPKDMAEGEYDSRKPFGVRYKVFAGREGRVTTREYWTSSEQKLQRAVAKIEALDNFYEIDGYSYPKESQGVAEGLTEMDKSQTPPGRDTGPREGPEKIAKPITKEKMVKHALDALSKSMAKKDDKKKDVKESDSLMLKLKRALIKEGRVKELADDLKIMPDSDFMKKYGKVKAAIRKDMKRVDEAAQTNYTPQEMADILSGKKTQQQVDAERAKKIDDQTDDLVMRVDKQGRRVDKNGKLLPPPKTWTNPPINPPPGKMQQYEDLNEQNAAGQQFVGTGTSSNWQMSVDIAARDARRKAAQSIAGTANFPNGVQLPAGTKYGPQDTKSDGTGKYVSTYTITLPAPSQSAEPPPAAPANNYLDSSPATSGATGSMSTGAPAAVGPATGNYMKVNELSTNKLSQYKTAAAKDAKKADQAGDFKRGDRRLGGMVQATKKQFDNDAKKVDESRAARRALMARIVNAR